MARCRRRFLGARGTDPPRLVPLPRRRRGGPDLIERGEAGRRCAAERYASETKGTGRTKARTIHVLHDDGGGKALRSKKGLLLDSSRGYYSVHCVGGSLVFKSLATVQYVHRLYALTVHCEDSWKEAGG